MRRLLYLLAFLLWLALEARACLLLLEVMR